MNSRDTKICLCCGADMNLRRRVCPNCKGHGPYRAPTDQEIKEFAAKVERLHRTMASLFEPFPRDDQIFTMDEFEQSLKQ